MSLANAHRLTYSVFAVGFCLLLSGCSGEPESATVLFELSHHQADVNVSIDGDEVTFISARPAFELEVGHHLLEVKSEAYEPVRQQFEVVAGENDLIRIELRPKASMATSEGTAISAAPELREQTAIQPETATDSMAVPSEASADSLAEQSIPGGDISVQSENRSTDEDQDELTAREIEVAEWAVHVGGRVIDGPGLRLWFPEGAHVVDSDFDRFQDLPHLQMLGFFGWLPGGKVRGPQLSDDAVVRLRGLPQLSIIGLHGPLISDRSLEHLATFPLQSIHIADANISDEGLLWFKSQTIRDLELNHCRKVGDRGIMSLDLAQADAVRINRTSITDMALPNIATASNTYALGLWGNKISGEGLRHLRSLERLVSLNILHVSLRDPQVDDLLAHQSLRSLWMTPSELTARGYQRMLEGLPKLISLATTRVPVALNERIDWSVARSLKKLSLSDSPINGAILRQVSRNKNLEDLHIRVDDEFFATRIDLQRFQSALPQCTINGMTVDKLIQELAAQGR